MDVPQDRFAELVAQADPPLDFGWALVTACADPSVDPAAQVGKLDDLAVGCPHATLDGLRAYVFEELGFRGNIEDYADPANSYLDAVLDRRLGIPITLSAVLIEVGRRVGVPIVGVGMPGHFLARTLEETPSAGGPFVDAFAGGRLLDEEDCRGLFARLHPDVPFDPVFLETVGTRPILWRILNNLREGFSARGKLMSVRWVVELQLAFPDLPVSERHHLAALLGMTGNVARAANELEGVADHLAAASDSGGEADQESQAERAEQARRQARVLRARLN